MKQEREKQEEEQRSLEAERTSRLLLQTKAREERTLKEESLRNSLPDYKLSGIEELRTLLKTAPDSRKEREEINAFQKKISLLRDRESEVNKALEEKEDLSGGPP